MKLKNLVLAATVSVTMGLFLSSCASNPNKAEKIDTRLDHSGQVSGDTELGVKNGNMVVQKKVMMNEELRKLQYEVYELEDRVYGNRKYGSLGLYGVLRDCKLQLSDPKNGGDGKLMWTEPIDRVTDKEDDFKIGLDESKKLVGVSEEFLSERIARFRGYKSLLAKRQDEYEEKLAICKSDLKSRISKATTSN
ncbi:MAG: hypothetical protein H7328_06195 [Bdellovibrio sp.]|nr:hypothetical protein [Bdellovibrio sp.]